MSLSYNTYNWVRTYKLVEENLYNKEKKAKKERGGVTSYNKMKR